MAGRRILLFVDNCAAHPQDVELTNIEVVFLPPNTTSLLQPMDMGIIKNLKGHYRSKLHTRLISELDLDVLGDVDLPGPMTRDELEDHINIDEQADVTGNPLIGNWLSR